MAMLAVLYWNVWGINTALLLWWTILCLAHRYISLCISSFNFVQICVSIVRFFFFYMWCLVKYCSEVIMILHPSFAQYVSSSWAATMRGSMSACTVKLFTLSVRLCSYVRDTSLYSTVSELVDSSYSDSWCLLKTQLQSALNSKLVSTSATSELDLWLNHQMWKPKCFY